MAGHVVNGSTPFNAAEMNKFMSGDTYTNGHYMCVSYRIQYDGANWIVTANHGTEQSVGAVAPVWNAGDNRLDITLSLTRPFTATPTAIVSPWAGASHASGPRHNPHALASSTTAIIVRFVAPSAPTAYATSLSTGMAFYLTLIGAVD